MTNKMKLPSFLALILILFLSLSAISASGLDATVADSSDRVIEDHIGISDSDNSSSLLNELDEELIDSNKSELECNDLDDSIDDSSLIDSNKSELECNDLDDSIDDSSLIDSNKSELECKDLDDSDLSIDESISSKDSKKSHSTDSKSVLKASSPIVIDASSYSKYFDSNGLIKSGSLNDGDSIKIKSISDKVFTINKRLSISSDNGQTLTNCIIRLIEGSSGSVLNNLNIVNTNDKVTGSKYYLSGISIIDSNYNTISNSTVNVSLNKCFSIMMSNASHNRIINNTLISGKSSTIPMTASSYNEIRDNSLESDMTNMVYQSGYGNGDFMPIDDGLCIGNIIANNHLKSRNGIYDSYCYAICLMQSASGNGAVIANNTIENAYYGIVADAPNTLIYNNTIRNIGGPAAIYASGENITISRNDIFTEHTDIHTWNPDGNVAAIENSGKNNIIANNIIRSIGSDAIVNTGIDVMIVNNSIYAESANCINNVKSNVLIENNTIEGVNSSGVMVCTSRLAENITIRNNDFVTDRSAIVLRGNVSYSLVSDNRINVSGDSEGIAVLKYTNRNPITPSHNAIYNNTINSIVINTTNSTANERNDTPGSSNGTNGTGNATNSSINGTYSGNKINTTISIINSSVIKGYELSICLNDNDGNPISGAKIIFKFMNGNYESVTDNDGKARLQINANVGNYAMNIYYAGNDTFNPSNLSGNVNVIRNKFIVTEDNFYTCFDENGYLKSDYADYELVFKGDFSKKRIILNNPVYMMADSARLFDSVIKVESGDVIVEGFEIINSNHGNAEDNHRFAILLDNVRNAKIIKNKIKLDSFDNGYGIYVSESKNCTIADNDIQLKADKLTFGIILYDSDGNSLKNNNLSVNGTGKSHLYDSSIKVDSSISVDDSSAEGMVIPEVYKTYGIILFYSSSNDIGYNRIRATSALNSSLKDSTNSIVGIDLYYESSFNKVHDNNVNVTAKDPYLYGLGVLGAETGKRDQVAANNSFTGNDITVSGTYYAAGLIAGYNSINTTMSRNRIRCSSNNVSYGAILEGAESTVFEDNDVICNSRINYLLEGYDTDSNRIGKNRMDYGDKALVVRAVALYNSKNNVVSKNSLPSLKPLIPRLVKEINSVWKLKNPGSNLVFTEKDIIYKGTSSPMIIRKNGKDYNLLDLLDYEPTSHPDVISPDNQLFDDIGGKNNVFEDNEVREASDGGSSGGKGSGSGGSSSGGGSHSGGSESGDELSSSNSDGNGTADSNSGENSNLNGSGSNSNSTLINGNTVGTSSSAPVTESATAYNLDVDEEPAATARSLSLGGMNAPVLIIILLLIFACASELIKRSKRNIK